MPNSLRRLRKNRRHTPKSSNKTWLMIGGLLVVFVFTLVVTPVAIAAGVYFYYAQDLVLPDTMESRVAAPSTRIYDRNGKLLYEMLDPQGGKRITVPLSEISLDLQQATIATEDADFLRNIGINIKGLVRAIVQNLLGEEEAGGGSSITQQLVKNVLIPEEERGQRLISRKIKEAILSYELTRTYSKDQILEWYLNEIYYGNFSYGIEAAAQNYFGKSAKDLTLAESAMLAGLPQAPSDYDPLEHPEAAKHRQSTVLDLMVRQGYITEAEAEAAKQEKLSYTPRIFPIQAPHFVMYVRSLLEEKYDPDTLYRGGLKVTTTLDLEMQSRAQAIARKHVERLEQHNAHNASLVAIKPQTGEILTMLGSVDYWDAEIDGQVNIATSERQPGSAFKPFNYVTAFTKGFTPATMLLDVRTSFPDGTNPPYVPANVDYRYRGPVLARVALACSLNIPAVRTIAYAGVEDVIETAHKMGITTLNRKNFYGLALTLGGGEVKLLDMVYAYGVFANGGVMAGVEVAPQEQQPGMRKLDPVAILGVEDADGNVLEEYKAPQEEQIISPQLAYLITDILSDNDARALFFGADNPLRLSDRPAAAKTGTTEDWRDNWTVGYTPDLAVGVWVGNADNEPMYESYGSTAAAPIWREFMETVLEGTPATPFTRPEGLKEVEICAKSGLLPGPNCTATTKEIFIEGTEPTETCNMHRVIGIDKTTGKLATSQTPPENIELVPFEVLPAEAADWARENNIPQPPTEYAPPPSSSKIAITSPKSGSTVGGQLAITGSASSDRFAGWSLEYGEGLSPSQWTPICPLRDYPVNNGHLTTFDTAGLEGLYSLRLSVIDEGEGLKHYTIPITIDNTPPMVEVAYPYPNSTIELDPYQPPIVGIQAEVQDNYGVGNVEFFVDNKAIGFTTVFPHNRPWNATPGTHTIYVEAYDKAGNKTQSEPITVTIY